ncbi:MAG: TIGR04552 family protein [Bacteriovoracaceae bacterium]
MSKPDIHRPDFLADYMYDWELLDVLLGGRSALDTKYFIASLNSSDEVDHFLTNYGIDPNRPVSQAELFGNYQEALQFTRRYFLKEGNKDGLDLEIPHAFLMITDVRELFLMSTGNLTGCSKEERLWAEVILKIMHTILHVDKDLRSSYFSSIQTQIFDRFYRYIARDENENLTIGSRDGKEKIQIADFETKSKKSRDSVIIKLLHKPENVAEELFDRVGVRIVTENKLDILKVLKFLLKHNIVIPHNIKPSRSVNTIFDLEVFSKRHRRLVKECLRKELSEEAFCEKLESALERSVIGAAEGARNPHSSNNYRSIQFTCRQLIKYTNPFFKEFQEVRQMAKENPDEEMAKKILGLDHSLISSDTRFFYPYEVQVVDKESYKVNTEGKASHTEYKNNQVASVIRRIFWALLKHKNIDF